MVKVLILARNSSEQLLVKINLPEFAVFFPVERLSEAEILFKKSVPDAVVVGSSACPDDLSGIISRCSKPEIPVFILYREKRAETADSGNCGSIYHIKTPDGLKKIRNAVNELISNKLKSINDDGSDWVYRKISAFAGCSAAAEKVKSQILKFAPAPGPVLISGESGTGKEVVAKLLHDFSGRKNRIYYALNAGAIPRGLCETELFGSEAGAYTGAVTRKGCFEHADGGTLFLDEIGELDLDLQVELLRVLEGGKVKRVGSNEYRRTDVRLISATNRGLMKQIEKGTFRKDLFYRINMFMISIPPLRERLDDIPELLRHFSLELQRDCPDISFEFSDSFIDCLFEHDWPGNIREFRNVIHRAVYSSETRILTADSLTFSSLEKD